MTRKLLAAALALPLFAAACDGPTDPNAPSRVAVKFGTSSTSRSVAPSSGLLSTASTSGLTVTGSNGTLTITDIRFIVAELELECDDDDATPACAEFEAPPSFVKLPLGTGTVEVASAAIPNGVYTELEFEVEDLDDDEDDPKKAQQVRDLFTAIRTTHGFADFPQKASMVVVGTFNGTPFRTYFEAEIEVEMKISPALEVTDAGASRTLTVDVQPATWFKRPDGTVWDLSQADFARTGRLVEFELEMEKGFTKVKVDD